MCLTAIEVGITLYCHINVIIKASVVAAFSVIIHCNFVSL